MKKVRAIVTAPFRFVGRLLKKLVHLLGAPFRAIGKLAPRVRIAVIVGAAVVVVLLVLALKPGPSDATVVRETLDDFAAATRDKDYQTLCDDLYSTNLVSKIRAAGLPCEVALRTGLEDRQNPQLAVLALEVNDDDALARVRSTAAGEVPSVDTVRLVREDDGWRVDSLSEPAGGG